jgi:hypothetical protein
MIRFKLAFIRTIYAAGSLSEGRRSVYVTLHFYAILAIRNLHTVSSCDGRLRPMYFFSEKAYVLFNIQV